MVSAKHVQRQKTVVVVVSVKEPAILIAVNFCVGGVEVEHQFSGKFFERTDERIDQSSVGAVLETAKRGWTGQGAVLAQRRLEQGVVAQLIDRSGPRSQAP